jgi:hypothetical protein
MLLAYKRHGGGVVVEVLPQLIMSNFTIVTDITAIELLRGRHNHRGQQRSPSPTCPPPFGQQLQQKCIFCSLSYQGQR